LGCLTDSLQLLQLLNAEGDKIGGSLDHGLREGRKEGRKERKKGGSSSDLSVRGTGDQVFYQYWSR